MRHRGKLAEDLVALHLQSRGWQLLKRNYQGRSFEIDLIVRGGDTLAFVEVKYRRLGWQGLAETASLLPLSKRQALLRGARHFLAATQGDLYSCQNFRFDLALVLGSEGASPGLWYFPAVFSDINR